ncbi:hypothetical protein [Pseudidiomarina homiensis]|uniref:hypothetical protein n=1 Tax=Pseudidiomarina homiensis TaxID=364198 RepID=UPI00215B134F|nr:hypothetical protein [Pseudidiomarina homiensis]
MKSISFILTIVALANFQQVFADEYPAAMGENAAKAKFDAYIQASYGNNFSCGARLLTPDEALMYRYTAGEMRDVASFSDALKVTDYTPIYDLAKQKARPAVVSHVYYIED